MLNVISRPKVNAQTAFVRETPGRMVAQSATKEI